MTGTGGLRVDCLGREPTSGASASMGLTFGRFELLPHRRELRADGQPLKLGGRAFDVLSALIDARGSVVQKDALMALVWPDRIVEENNLQSQISALRAAFGTERDLIRTLCGRGYQFTGEIRNGPVTARDHAGTRVSAMEATAPRTNLTMAVSSLIGREDDLRHMLSTSAYHRLVTLTGAGGIGKTEFALAAARQLLPDFAEGVWVVDLASLVEPAMVPAAVAAAIGLDLPCPSPEHVASTLSGKRLLVVLDNCDPVIDAAAAMAEALLRANPEVRVMATSREALRIDGESVYRVTPLAVPPEDSDSELLQYGACQLFVERVRAVKPKFELDPSSVARIATVCRLLDGNPLAIELAAARVPALGLDHLTGPLDEILPLLAGGRRTAPRRHHSMRAALDWSYARLSDCERFVLRRLARFTGRFDLDAAVAVAASTELAPAMAINALIDLVGKSMVALDGRCAAAPYCLTGVTRAYVIQQPMLEPEVASPYNIPSANCGATSVIAA